MAIRFHFDEHVSPTLAEALRRKGVDVSTSQEAALLGSDDLDQISFAIHQERILVTFDDDFLLLGNCFTSC
jgi:predicted nuclease of predicted toxin-antitoxin system